MTARTAAKESWNEIEKTEGGWTIRSIIAAIANVLIRSCSLSTKNAIKNTITMITARWVDGDMPERRPYTSTGTIDKRTAPFFVQACNKKNRICDNIHLKNKNDAVAMIPIWSPEMASRCPAPTRLNDVLNSGDIAFRSPTISAFNTPCCSLSPIWSIRLDIRWRASEMIAPIPLPTFFSIRVSWCAAT